MTNADRFLIAMLEDMRRDQLDPLLRIAEQKGISVGDAVLEAMRGWLECITPQERAETIEVFERDGIDLEEFS
jgi:hypothetical protein